MKVKKTKLKTRKSLTRRIKVTKTGKVLRRQGFKRHLNVKKSAKRKRSLRKIVPMSKTYAKKIRKYLGK